MSYSIALAGLLLSACWWIVPPVTHASKAHQDMMKACNVEADAQGFSGEAVAARRRAFMKSCLAAKAAAGRGEALAAVKKKDCVKEATLRQLQGAARQKFMSGCLK